MPTQDDPQALRLADFEALAQPVLSPGAYAYFSGGAGREVSMSASEASFVARQLRPRVLVDVSRADSSVTVFGQTWSAPIGIAPTAHHGLAHSQAEAATARAAETESVVYCASTSSTLSCEAIAAAAKPGWFQLYVQDGPGPETESLVERAQAAGYRALVLTVDLPVLGIRDRERRLCFDNDALPFGNFPNNPRKRHPSSVASYAGQVSRASFTWKEVAWLRERLRIPLVLKGILTAEDARLAVEHGADAVWVSNHGGRQLDGCAVPIDVLEEVGAAVARRVPLFVDGGVRRGTDVLTALALGAQLVFVGRPIVFALAHAGEAGVRSALSLLKEELLNAMCLLGTPKVADIERSHVV